MLQLLVAELDKSCPTLAGEAAGAAIRSGASWAVILTKLAELKAALGARASIGGSGDSAAAVTTAMQGSPSPAPAAPLTSHWGKLFIGMHSLVHALHSSDMAAHSADAAAKLLAERGAQNPCLLLLSTAALGCEHLGVGQLELDMSGSARVSSGLVRSKPPRKSDHYKAYSCFTEGLKGLLMGMHPQALKLFGQEEQSAALL